MMKDDRKTSGHPIHNRLCLICSQFFTKTKGKFYFMAFEKSFCFCSVHHSVCKCHFFDLSNIFAEGSLQSLSHIKKMHL